MWPWTEKAHRRMQRKSTAALCLILAVILLACSRNGPPNSVFESSGYHVSDGKVYYLNAFPGKAVEITDADPATFEALDPTYGVDTSHVYINGVVLPEADAASFELLDRAGWARDSEHVFQREHAVSDDPAHFELLDGELSKDSRVVYWSDGSVLSDDPAHFTIVSHVDHYLYTKDSSTVHVNGNPISGRRSGDIASPARRLRTRRPPCLLFRSADRRCGPFVIPPARGSLTPLIPHASTGWAKQSTGRTPAPSVSSTRTSNARRTISAPTTDRR